MCRLTALVQDNSQQVVRIGIVWGPADDASEQWFGFIGLTRLNKADCIMKVIGDWRCLLPDRVVCLAGYAERNCEREDEATEQEFAYSKLDRFGHAEAKV